MHSFSIPVLAILLAAACSTAKQPADTGDTSPPPPEVDNDADGDGILDIHEGTDDPDGDGIPNMEDTDSDGDGIPDSVEAGDDDPATWPFDTDMDGTPDFLDLDSDDNGISDKKEAGKDKENPRDTDGDGLPDFQDDDNDGDSILDVWELDHGSEAIDTDGDGTADYRDLDSDDDSLCDSWEGGTTRYRPEPVDTDGDGTADYRDLDSDGDGLSDEDEAAPATTCGEPQDTDGDGSYNSADLDSDGDGLSDVDELYTYGTDPYDDDSDGDGQTDGAELAGGTDPLDSESKLEGLYVEVQERNTVEAPFDFQPKIQYGDVTFLIDTTGSMSGTMQATAQIFGDVVTELDADFEDLAFGLATFDDYPFGSMGSGSDRPFILRQQITTDTAAMQTALNTIPLHSGGDGQEADMEALHQAITGMGYDMGCDGGYDANKDVPPFVASSSDAFNGSATGTYDSTVTGTGSRGGMGFRDWSMAFIVYATDSYMRDQDSSIPELAQGPGGCPQDAGSNMVISELEDLGGYLIGVDVGSYDTSSQYSPYAQMLDLANATGSLVDEDGDGSPETPLVFKITQGNPSFADDFKQSIVDAVDQAVNNLTFQEVHLEVEGDEWGMVQSITPDHYEDVDPKVVDELSFELEFLGTVAATEDDQVFTMTLNVIGDDTILLDSLDIVVVVPGF